MADLSMLNPMMMANMMNQSGCLCALCIALHAESFASQTKAEPTPQWGLAR